MVFIEIREVGKVFLRNFYLKNVLVCCCLLLFLKNKEVVICLLNLIRNGVIIGFYYG